MSKKSRPSLKEIQEKMNEITHRKPTSQQIDELKDTLEEIEKNNPSTEENRDYVEPPRKIAIHPESEL